VDVRGAEGKDGKRPERLCGGCLWCSFCCPTGACTVFGLTVARVCRGRRIHSATFNAAPSLFLTEDKNGFVQNVGPPGSPPIEDLPAGDGGAARTGGPAERTKGSVKLFCGQIGRDMDADGLRKMLEPYGPIQDVGIIKDRVTGFSKGCAFVTFTHRKDAAAAISAIHGVHTVPGHPNPVQLSYARGEEPENQPEAKLFVGNMPRQATEEQVRALFSSHGEIEEIFIMRDKVTQESKGAAFVKFIDYDCASAAIKVCVCVCACACGGAHTYPIRTEE
jgi:hypothetical protein